MWPEKWTCWPIAVCLLWTLYYFFNWRIIDLQCCVNLCCTAKWFNYAYICGDLVAKSCPTLVTPRTVAHQTSLSIGFSRQECWNGLPFPSPGDLPDPGIEPGSPALQADSLLTEPLGKPYIYIYMCVCVCVYSESCSVMSDSLQPPGLYILWNSPGQNTGVGNLSLF